MTAPKMTSVVMVSYHTGPVLDQAIESVLSQDADVELVLVNNGNPPEVEADLIARFKDEPLVRVMTGHGNIGFGRACNLGARVAQGDSLLFLNPDGVLPPGAITHLHKLAMVLKHPYMVGARLLDGDGKDQSGSRRALLTPTTALIEALHLQRFFPKLRFKYHEEPVPKALTPMPAISGAFMFIPMVDFSLLRGFDENFFLHVEDLDLCWRFRQAGGEIYFDPALIVRHMGGTSNVTSLFIEKNKARGFVQYFEKNFGPTTPGFIMLALKAAIWLRYGLKVLVKPLRRK